MKSGKNDKGDYNIVDFYFPQIVLQKDDFMPIDVFVLKDYYRNSFFNLIGKVRNIYLKQHNRWAMNHPED
jgi:hypothetical protein